MRLPKKRLSDFDYIQAADLRLALRTFHASSERVIGKHGLTPGRYELLLLVKVSEPGKATVSQLAERLSIGQSAVTQLVRRAENDGLLERRFSPDDARVHHLRLTQEGKQRLASALAELGPQRHELTEALAALRRQPSRDSGSS
jgi:DNA-binding MarR family transcriptional regulator